MYSWCGVVVHEVVWCVECGRRVGVLKPISVTSSILSNRNQESVQQVHVQVKLPVKYLDTLVICSKCSCKKDKMMNHNFCQLFIAKCC